MLCQQRLDCCIPRFCTRTLQSNPMESLVVSSILLPIMWWLDHQHAIAIRMAVSLSHSTSFDGGSNIITSPCRGIIRAMVWYDVDPLAPLPIPMRVDEGSIE